MRLLDGRRQYDDFLRGAIRRQCEAFLRRVDLRQRPKRFPKPPDLNPQPGAVGFIGVL